MTNIEQLRKEKEEKQKKELEEWVDIAIKLHNEQKNSIKALIEMPWYKTIKDFWILQEQQATQALKNVRFTDLQEFWRVQAKSNIAEKFITFLNNLEK